MRLELIESWPGKIKRCLPIGIRLDPCNARPVGLVPGSPIYHGDCGPLASLHCHRRRRQLQEGYVWQIKAIRPGGCVARLVCDDGPEYVVPRLHYVVAPDQVEFVIGCRFLIINQDSPASLWWFC